MSEVERSVKVITHQHILEGVPSGQEGFPQRAWSIEVVLLDAAGQQVPATIIDRVAFHLHPTFHNPVRTITKPPFKLEEEGWGGFEILVKVYFIDKAGHQEFIHDLNFAQNDYENVHKIKVPLKKSANLRKLLAESGPVPSADEGSGEKRKGAAVSDSKNKRSKLNNQSVASAIKGNIDLEKLAENLTELNEDDLLGVVQMVTDNRTPEMNIKNDIDEGEFTMDLYTLPDGLLKSLWDYVKKRVEA